MFQIRTLIITFLVFLSNSSMAVETCSRIAIINYQEVLVDTNSTEKGEGLRFHLEKDRTAKSYLDLYQEGTKIGLENAVMGTLGTSMMLGGILSNAESSKKQTLLIGGATLMIINFLVAKTMETSNEQNLRKAIEEYNKRNLPKIYYNPDQEDNRGNNPGVSFMLQKSWDF
ncbi:MAG: hypothetical protein NXH75_04610 [Halobacteriovoraceae bacterium]|nr:hypothetical protein [Halobacteriovoraceae bacterium]